MFQNVQKSCSQLIQRQGKISERLCLPQHSPFDQNCSVPSQKQPIHHRGRILCSFQTFGSESGTEPRFSCRQIINVFLIIVSDTDQMVFKPTMMQKNTVLVRGLNRQSIHKSDVELWKWNSWFFVTKSCMMIDFIFFLQNISYDGIPGATTHSEIIVWSL